LLVCLGGALGSGARYLVSLGFAQLVVSRLPWGTLIVNLVGSFAIELAVHAAARTALSPLAALTLATGVVGGFTTYSAFDNQILALVRAGSWAAGALYLGATVLGCLVAGLLGIAAGQALWGR
jgi:fluoride exporter